MNSPNKCLTVSTRHRILIETFQQMWDQCPVTLKTIYQELLELKRKVERLELLLILPEEELPPAELQELKQISERMSQREKIHWKQE